MKRNIYHSNLENRTRLDHSDLQTSTSLQFFIISVSLKLFTFIFIMCCKKVFDSKMGQDFRSIAFRWMFQLVQKLIKIMQMFEHRLSQGVKFKTFFIKLNKIINWVFWQCRCVDLSQPGEQFEHRLTNVVEFHSWTKQTFRGNDVVYFLRNRRSCHKWDKKLCLMQQICFWFISIVQPK